MGFLDTVEGYGGPEWLEQCFYGSWGLMQALEEHPGGLAGLISSFKNNGMAAHVQQGSNGQQPTATPDQIQQGLRGTDLVDRVAGR